MTTTYIIWNTSDDIAFRTRYLEITGEAIQAHPSQSADGTQHMVGSGRITPAQLAVLQSEFTMGTDPAAFIPQAVDEPV